MNLSIFPPEKIHVYHLDRVDGKTVRYLADREMGGVQAFAIGISTLSSGVIGNTGSHDSEEVFYFLRGKAVVVIDGNAINVESGTVVVVPPDVPHRIENNSSDECAYLWVVAPQPERMAGLRPVESLDKE